MNILEAIVNTQDGAAVRQLGSQFGLGQEQTTAALSALLPALAAGVQRNIHARTVSASCWRRCRPAIMDSISTTPRISEARPRLPMATASSDTSSAARTSAAMSPAAPRNKRA